MKKKRIDMKEIRKLHDQKYHITGELHFLRSEKDLYEVCANSMQSIKIILTFFKKIQDNKKSHIEELARMDGSLKALLRIIQILFGKLNEDKEKGERTVCIPAICISMECVSKILTKSVSSLIQLSNKYEKGLVISVLAEISRLDMMTDFILESSIKADQNEMFYQPPTAELWKTLYDGQYVKIEKLESKKFDKKYQKFESDVLTLTAAASKSLESKEISFGSAVNTAFNAVYYNIFKSKGKQEAEKFLSAPNPETATKIMNMIDSKYTKPLLSLAMPKIAVNKRIYVPKLLPRLTTKNVLYPEDLSKFKETLADMQEESEDLLTFDTNKRFIEHQREKWQSVSTTYVVHKMKPLPDSYVKIRILSPDTLPKDRAPGKGPSKKDMRCDRVLIDIHGGGFISTTTRCHQTYLRRWANECNMIIFATDYKLAPEVKYPGLFDDVWQAYFWIITQAEHQFGITLRSVLVAGDSAGGNLAMAVTLRAIKSHFRVPDGVLLGYPALNLSIRAFTPSLLAAMDDFILRYSFLNICINSYIPSDANPSKDPYLSPALISDEDLIQFPPVRIMAAGRDPLRDESYRLINRLAHLKKDAQLIEYRMFPHAFWSLDAVFGIQECRFATNQAIDWLGKMFAKRESVTSSSHMEFEFSI